MIVAGVHVVIPGRWGGSYADDTLVVRKAVYCLVMSTKAKLDFCDMEVLTERFYAEDSARSYVEHRPSGRCWLCKQQRPFVTFKKEAHVLPQSLGNRAWLTRDECDECNELIGRYESALVACLAAFRLTSGYKRGRPKFRDPKSGSFLLSADQESNIVVRESAATGGLAEISSDSEVLLRVPIDGHRPLSICKVLARMALLLNPDTRRSHRHLLKWLLGRLVLPEQALLCGELEGGNVFSPGIRVYRRSEGDGKDIAVALTYGGVLFWYALPRNLEIATSIFVDRAMIKELAGLSWSMRSYSEESVVVAHHAAVTLVREPT